MSAGWIVFGFASVFMMFQMKGIWAAAAMNAKRKARTR